MAQLTGSNTILAARLHSTIDVPGGPAGSGHKMLVDSINHSRGTTALTATPIGAGLSMLQDSDTGAVNPTVSISKTVKYDDQGNGLLGQFMGTETVAAWAGSLSVHSIAFNSTLNANYMTVAFQATTTEVFEYINSAVKAITFSAKPNDYLKATYDIIATDRKITGTTNTAATLASANEPSSAKPVIVRPSHTLRINAQAGSALASPTDNKAITSAELKLERPQEIVQEIRGASGAGAPRATDLFSATLTCTFKTLQDFTWFTAQEAGTEYKIDGSFTDGANREFTFLLPRVKIVADPDFNVSDDGENPLTVTFKSLVASTAPSGMFSTMPHFRIVNGTPKYTL